VIAGLALWRIAEILTWYLKLLFDKAHRVFLEVERNLFFLATDTLGLVTALAIVLETAKDDDLSRRWSDAFSAFTLNGAPDGYKSGWATTVGILGAVGGLLSLRLAWASSSASSVRASKMRRKRVGRTPARGVRLLLGSGEPYRAR
jgi:hypothetical protein